MTSHRESNLSMRKRIRLGNILRASWIVRLREATGCELGSADFLSLDETDELKRRFVDKLRDPAADRWRRSWERDKASEVITVLAESAQRGGDKEVALFSDAEQYVGAALIQARLVLSRPFDVWKVVGEDLSLATTDLEHGLCLELNTVDEMGRVHSRGFYELTSWGAFTVRPNLC